MKADTKHFNRISLPFNNNLQRATFIERPNRYIVRCQLDQNTTQEAEGKIIEAHLGDPGRLKELLIPGCTIWLSPANNPQRKTAWTAVLVESTESNALVSLISTLPNYLIEKALQNKALKEFSDWSLVRREIVIGNSRFDFLLKKTTYDILSGKYAEKNMALEVKSVTLVNNSVGRFPDAITTRGAKHLNELAEIAGREGWEAAVLFVAQREDLKVIQPAMEIDPKFASALSKAKRAGVWVFGRKCRVTLEQLILSDPLEVDVDIMC